MAQLLKFFRVNALPAKGVVGGLYFVHGGEIAAGNGKLYVCTAENTFELYSGANASELTTKLNDYVLKTQKIAGVDLQDDITAEELKTALGLGSAAYTEATAYDVAGAADTVKTELVNGETEFADFKAVGDELRALDLAAAAKVANVTVGGTSVVNADKVAVLGTAAGKAIEDFDAAGSAATAESNANKYTDGAKAAIIGDATEAGNTLGKLEDKIQAVEAAAVSVKEDTINHVKVTKTGTEYTVEGVDIASAQDLANEIKRAGDEEARIAGLVTAEATRATKAEEALDGRLNVIEGEGEGSIKKAVSDAKTELIGDATTSGNTLGKLEDRIETIVANEKTYSIAKVESGLGENVKEAYKLVDEDGTQVGETINIYKDSSLISVELTDTNAEGVAGQFIKYTYVLATGVESVQYVDVSRLLVEAEFKNGLEVSQAGEVSVKVDAASEAFLSVSEAGVKLSGVQTAINTAAAKATTVVAEGTDAGNNLSIVETFGEDGHSIYTVNLTDVASAAALATLDAEVQEHEQVVAGALNDLNDRLTAAEGSVADHETRLTQAEADIDALQATVGGLDLGVKTVKGQGGEYVTVTPAEASKGDVTVLVSVATTKATNTAYTNDALATDGYVEEQAAAAESNAKTYADNLMSWVEF